VVSSPHPDIHLLHCRGGLVPLLVYLLVCGGQCGLKKVIQKANMDPDQVLASQTWVVILVLSILVGIILLGIFIIFVYNQKTVQLYRLQRNFINNFTHELKTRSPL